MFYLVLPSFFCVYLPSFVENWVSIPSTYPVSEKLGILTQYLPSFEFSKLPSLVWSGHAPGERPVVERVIEQRLTTIGVALLVGRQRRRSITTQKNSRFGA
ncbi:MAG: hypothetical protein GY820_40290 [Gammaproteobacteria bacterium]|nr:hypothetical protein [Gammaproteobacteria bacterium]